MGANRAQDAAGTVLVTGASRGIGLEHCVQYAERGWQVIACARDPARAPGLAALLDRHPGQVRLATLDVTAAAQVTALAESLAGGSLDIVINNAGSYGPLGAPAGMAYQGAETMDYAIWREILEVNLLGPFRVAVALQSALRAGRRRLLVMMSSDLGSIENNRSGQSYAYRSSKAALNMVTRGLAAEWPDIAVVAIAPGWTRTTLGGVAAPLGVAETVADQQALFERLTLGQSGSFVDRFGRPVPW